MVLMNLQNGGGVQFQTLTPLSSPSLRKELLSLDSHPSSKQLPIITPNCCDTWTNFMEPPKGYIGIPSQLTPLN